MHNTMFKITYISCGFYVILNDWNITTTNIGRQNDVTNAMQIYTVNQKD